MTRSGAARLLICLRRAGVMAIMVMTLGCAKPDPHLIIGDWHAEGFIVDSLKLPIAPNFEVTRNEMILKSPAGLPIQSIPLAGIKAYAQTIEVEFRGGYGVALVFLVDSHDKVRLKVPLVGYEIVYRRS